MLAAVGEVRVVDTVEALVLVPVLDPAAVAELEAADMGMSGSRLTWAIQTCNSQCQEYCCHLSHARETNNVQARTHTEDRCACTAEQELTHAHIRPPTLADARTHDCHNTKAHHRIHAMAHEEDARANVD